MKQSVPPIADIVILTEDRHFYRHHGINLMSMLRAFVVNFSKKRYAEGGSTITQQLARTMFLHNKKTLFRKLLEIIFALYLEFNHSKTQILDMYMSLVYMGHRKNGVSIRGFDDASKYYFKKIFDNTSIAERAALVAMLRGPNRYCLWSNSGIARRTVILSNMLDSGLIDTNAFFESIKIRFDKTL